MWQKLRTDISLLLPAFVISLSFIELSTGTLVAFRAVGFFYLYVAFFLVFRTGALHFSLQSSYVWIYVVVVLLYLVAAITGTIYKTVSGELFNILWWSIFSVLSALEVKTLERWRQFLRYLSFFVMLGTFVAAVMGLYKAYLLEIMFEVLPFAIDPSDNTLLQGSTLNADYNLYALGLIFGVFCGKFLKDNSKSVWPRVISYLTLPVFVTSIFFSGSRRGLFFTLIFLLIYFYFSFNVQVAVARTSMKAVVRTVGIFAFAVMLFFSTFSVFEKAIEDADFVSGVQRLATTKDQLTKSGENERTRRWEYIDEKLSETAGIKSWIVGEGFDYLALLGKKFNYGSDDNPHNFLIATFLYGGLISLLSLLILLFSVCRLMVHNGAYTLMFFFLAFTVVFSLTSSNTLFAYRFIPFLLLFPLIAKVGAEQANPVQS